MGHRRARNSARRAHLNDAPFGGAEFDFRHIGHRIGILPVLNRIDARSSPQSEGLAIAVLGTGTARLRSRQAGRRRRIFRFSWPRSIPGGLHDSWNGARIFRPGTWKRLQEEVPCLSKTVWRNWPCG